VVNFTATADDPGDDTFTWNWDFGDGTIVSLGTEQNTSPNHSYADNGVYVVEGKATDDDGGVGTDTKNVTVNNLPPVADANGPYAGGTYGQYYIAPVGVTIQLDGSGSWDPGTADVLTYDWDYEDGGTFPHPGMTPDFTWPVEDTVVVQLRVTDDDGGQGFDFTEVYVWTSQPVTIDTDPTGAKFTADGVEYVAPQTFWWVIGSIHTIGVPLFQNLPDGWSRLWYDYWSDGGAREHDIVVPFSAAAFTAFLHTEYLCGVESAYGDPYGHDWYEAGRTANFGVRSTVHEVTAALGIEAVATERFKFTGWVGDGDGSYTGPDSAASVEMNNPISEVAQWEHQYYLATAASPPAGGTVTPASGWQADGDSVEISATANPGWAFTGWSGDAAGTDLTQKIYMDGAKSVTANFTSETENQPPVVNLPDLTVAEDETLTIGWLELATYVQDPDHALSELAVVLGGDLTHFAWTIDLLQGVLIWPIPENWNGFFQVIVTAIDPLGASDTDTSNVTVTPVNDPPGDFDLMSPADGDTMPNGTLGKTGGAAQTMADQLFEWSESANVDDINGDEITYNFHFGTDPDPANNPVVASTQDTYYNYVDIDQLAPGTYYWAVKAIDSGGLEKWSSQTWTVIVAPTGVNDRIGTEIPTGFALRQNYPNPFNPETAIQYEIPEAGFVSLKIYNAAGQLICTLIEEDMKAGVYEARWHGVDDTGNDVSSGLYIYVLRSGSHVTYKKMVFMK
jgi:uncharacterized repeat protein (TIGR02543 family)